MSADQACRAGAWIPAGWQIKRDQDWIAYRRPDGWTQSVTPHEPQHAHSQTLFMLLDAMLAAAPAAAPADGSWDAFNSWVQVERPSLMRRVTALGGEQVSVHVEAIGWDAWKAGAAWAAAPAVSAPAHFADGDSPCVLEWGAVSLPVGDPSRVTNLMLCRTLWDAIAEGALCGFDWRVYPMADVANHAAIQAPATGDAA